MEDKEYISKGFLRFYFMQDGLAAKKISREDYISARFPMWKKEEYEMIVELRFTKSIATMIEGLSFINMIKSGCINSYDGNIEEIYVDGYLSNLGIIADTFEDGQFLVTMDIFEEICREHEVLVNWSNK